MITICISVKTRNGTRVLRFFGTDGLGLDARIPIGWRIHDGVIETVSLIDPDSGSNIVMFDFSIPDDIDNMISAWQEMDKDMSREKTDRLILHARMITKKRRR